MITEVRKSELKGLNRDDSQLGHGTCCLPSKQTQKPQAPRHPYSFLPALCIMLPLIWGLSILDENLHIALLKCLVPETEPLFLGPFIHFGCCWP